MMLAVWQYVIISWPTQLLNLVRLLLLILTFILTRYHDHDRLAKSNVNKVCIQYMHPVIHIQQPILLMQLALVCGRAQIIVK